MVRIARDHGLPIASHGDDTPERIAQWAEYGIHIAEFPTTMSTARAAHTSGMSVGMGAPNVLRGKSSGGNLSALSAIEAGVVDWLCADYYPASLLPVIFRLADRGTLSLPAAVALVSYNPARAVGLDHIIGSIQPGRSADLICVRLMPDPVVQQVFVAGIPVIRGQNSTTSYPSPTTTGRTNHCRHQAQTCNKAQRISPSGANAHNNATGMPLSHRPHSGGGMPSIASIPV